MADASPAVIQGREISDRYVDLCWARRTYRVLTGGALKLLHYNLLTLQQRKVKKKQQKVRRRRPIIAGQKTNSRSFARHTIEVSCRRQQLSLDFEQNF